MKARKTKTRTIPKPNPYQTIPNTLLPWAEKIMDNVFRDDDGWWSVGLNHGWCLSAEEGHELGGQTLREICALLRGVQPCDCEDCKEELERERRKGEARAASSAVQRQEAS